MFQHFHFIFVSLLQWFWKIKWTNIGGSCNLACRRLNNSLEFNKDKETFADDSRIFCQKLEITRREYSLSMFVQTKTATQVFQWLAVYTQWEGRYRLTNNKHQQSWTKKLNRNIDFMIFDLREQTVKVLPKTRNNLHTQRKTVTNQYI